MYVESLVHTVYMYMSVLFVCMCVFVCACLQYFLCVLMSVNCVCPCVGLCLCAVCMPVCVYACTVHVGFRSYHCNACYGYFKMQLCC